MNRKFFKSLRALYEPMLVLIVIASAALLIGALYYAFEGGLGGKVSFDAAFDEVGGIKEGSSVLFKGMPVGAVGKMRYDAATDKILVRIEITKPVDVPANIKPYVEKSLMGQSNIALRTEQQTGTKELLAAVVRRHQAGDKDGLYRIDGVELSRLDAIKPGLDAKSDAAVEVATRTMHRMEELAAQGNGRYLRTTALVVSACSLVLNFTLIPRFGILGACYAGALAMVVNLALHFCFYRRAVQSLA